MSEQKFYTVEWEGRFAMVLRVEDEDEALEFALDSEYLDHDGLCDFLEHTLNERKFMTSGEEDYTELIEMCREKEEVWEDIKKEITIKEIPPSHKVLFEIPLVEY